MAAQALTTRAAAATTLKDTISDITRYTNKPNPSKRLLQVKLEKLLYDKDALFARHCTYAELSKKDTDSEEMLEWINPQMDAATDLADDLYLLIDEIEDKANTTQKEVDDTATKAAKSNEILVAEAQCETNVRTLNNCINTMIAIVNDDTKTAVDDATLVQAYLDQVNESLQETIKSWTDLTTLLGPGAKLNALLKNQETVKKDVADNSAKAAYFIKKYTPSPTVVSTSSSPTSSSKDSDHAQTEKVKFPTFNGDIRTFARFKSEFEMFVVPQNKSKQLQSYILTQNCLKGRALKLIENLTDIEEIWSRLSSRYGDEVEIMNVVIESIHSFTFKGTDVDSAIVKLVDDLEKGVQDLDAIKSKQHLENARTVTSCNVV